MKSRLEIFNRADAVELKLYGAIGQSYWDPDGISAKSFVNELDKIPQGTPIVIGINSPGGAVGEGLTMANAIGRRAADVTARIDGYALSIASWIPLSAGRVQTSQSSVWMIHKAWTTAQGNADDMRKAVAMLEIHDSMLVGGYRTKTGKSQEDIRAAMAAETWFTGEEARDWGLADEVIDAPAALAALDVDLSAHYQNIPGNILNLIQGHRPAFGWQPASDEAERVIIFRS